MQTIEIKPLHVMMFNQKLVHEILAKKSKNIQIRLFMNFYTSSSNLHVFHGNEYLDDVFERQSVPKLPSGQTCASIPKCYYNFERNFDTCTKHAEETFHKDVNHDIVANHTDPVTKQRMQTTVVRPGRIEKSRNGKEKFVWRVACALAEISKNPIQHAGPNTARHFRAAAQYPVFGICSIFQQHGPQKTCQAKTSIALWLLLPNHLPCRHSVSSSPNGGFPAAQSV